MEFLRHLFSDDCDTVALSRYISPYPTNKWGAKYSSASPNPTTGVREQGSAVNSHFLHQQKNERNTATIKYYIGNIKLKWRNMALVELQYNALIFSFPHQPTHELIFIRTM